MKTKRKANTMNIVVALLAVLVLAAMAWYAVVLLGGPSAKAVKAQALTQADTLRGLTMGGTDVELAAVAGTATGEKGKEYLFAREGSGIPTALRFESFDDTLVFANAPDETQITVQAANGETVFAGTVESFNADFKPDNGSYTLSVTAVYNTETELDGKAYPTGVELTYAAAMTYDIQISFHLSADTVSQGDVLLFCADGLDDPAGLQVELPFDFTPKFEKAATGCYAYIPFNYMRAAGEYTVTATYNGETMSFTYTVTEPDYEVQHLTVNSSTTSSTIGNNTAMEEYNNTFAALAAVADSEIYWTEDFIQPVAGTITTEFGIKRYTNNATTPTRHAGIDIATAEGTPIAASNDGRVIFAGYLQVSGNTVVIEHGMGVHTMYLHMSALDCAEGDMVKRGDTIGKVGMTGFSTGPHLHFQAQVGPMCISPWYLFDGSSGVYEMRGR